MVAKVTARMRCAGAVAMVAMVPMMCVSACGGSRAGRSARGATAAFRLSGGAPGAGHSGMSDSSMGGMHMSGSSMAGMDMSGPGSVPGEGAYLHQTPQGTAYLHQAGDRLTGWVTASGLPPGSHHAEDIRGPAGSCSPSGKRTNKIAVVLPELAASAHGVAHTRIDMIVHRAVVDHGYYLSVSRDPTLDEVDNIGSAMASAAFVRSLANDLTVLCGDLRGN